MRSRQKKGDRRNREVPEAGVARALVGAEKQARIFQRTLVTQSSISTGATGYLGVLNAASSANATSAVNWGSYQAIALEWRVKGIQLELMPIVSAQTTATTPPPTEVYSCAYSSDDVPTAALAVAQGPGGKTQWGMRPIKVTATPKGFANANLWIPTSGAMPAVNAFGIMIADNGTVPASTATTVYFRATIRYLVEFRSFT
jgi:hypothetical protein